MPQRNDPSHGHPQQVWRLSIVYLAYCLQCDGSVPRGMVREGQNPGGLRYVESGAKKQEEGGGGENFKERCSAKEVSSASYPQCWIPVSPQKYEGLGADGAPLRALMTGKLEIGEAYSDFFFCSVRTSSCGCIFWDFCRKHMGVLRHFSETTGSKPRGVFCTKKFNPGV